MLQTLILCTILIIVGMEAQAQEPSVVVVKPSSRDDSQADKLRDKIDATKVQELPRAGAEVWTIDAKSKLELGKLVKSGQLVYVEFMDAAAPAALSASSAKIEQLEPAIRQRAVLLTKGYQAQDYRIAEKRPIALTADLLEAGISNSQNVTLELVGGRRVVLRRTSVQKAASGTITWTGTGQAANGAANATLAVTGQGLTGTVDVANERFSILPLGDGRQLIRRVSPTSFPPDHPAKQAPKEVPDPPLADVAADVCKKDEERIDVLVGYTDAVGAALSDPRGLVEAAAGMTNNAMEASALSARVNVVGIEKWSYRESGSLNTDLNALVTRGDKQLDEAHQKRAAFKADVVVLLVSTGDACGWGADILANTDTAFAVIHSECAVDNRSFPHELGHLFGARHDVPSDNELTPFKYGHGYALKGEWRDIMAYPGDCGCHRLERWSDPLISYPDSQGKQRPLGETQCCDNARVIRETAKRLARFHCSSK